MPDVAGPWVCQAEGSRGLPGTRRAKAAVPVFEASPAGQSFPAFQQMWEDDEQRQ